MNGSPFAVFRADASAAIGIGHVMRCLVLADALRNAGWWTAFVCGEASPEAAPALAVSGHDLRLIGGRIEQTDFLTASWPQGCDLLVVDHYQLDRKFETTLRSWARRILVIDDLADRDHDADLLLDTSLGRRAADYRARVDASCRMLIGPGYALLRPQFAAARKRALARRSATARVERILVSLGGGALPAAMKTVLEGIRLSKTAAAIDVVVGASIDVAGEEFQATIRGLAGAVEIHRSVTDMAGLMVSADIAIGAGGVTTWERCCLGLPTILMVIADNQQFQAAAVGDLGAAFLLGRLESVTAAMIGEAIGELSADNGRRQAMATAASALCDGQGAERVVGEILSFG